jgi:hypothetical protein
MANYFVFIVLWVQLFTSKDLHLPNVAELSNSNFTTNNREKLLAKKGKEALQFCKVKHYNTQFCILINLGIHSGLNRFVVYDLQQQKAIKYFPVSHGCGQHWWGFTNSKENPEFSYQNGSHLSSLGKYRVGQRAASAWGVNIKYFLHGLDANNKNAFARQIVFHSWSLVSDTEIYPSGTPEGWGCPAISNKNFIWLDPKLQASKLPVLMWIYR